MLDEELDPELSEDVIELDELPEMLELIELVEFDEALALEPDWLRVALLESL